jgi:uncharacterized membrane protein HdeD (DUF308 family)
MFVIRAILGLGVSVVITKMFRGEIQIPYVVGLAIIIVGLAYFAEYIRKRREDKERN